MTQVEAGALVKHDHSWISRVESGELMPEWHDIEALLKGYEMTAAELFGQVDIESKEYLITERYYALRGRLKKAVDLLLGMPQKKDGKEAEGK